MNFEAAHLEVAERNALRRAARLPQLDVCAEVQAVLYREQAREWERAAERHEDEFKRLYAAVVEEDRRKYGRDQPSSVFGGQSLLRQAHQQFVDYLARQGHTHPRYRSTGTKAVRGTSHADEVGPSLRPNTEVV